MKFAKILFMILMLASTANSGQSIRELLTPPSDSADKKNLRVWVHAQRNSTCRMSITIGKGENSIIRHLIDTLIPPGFINFYWDKKTDQGKLVPAGIYDYIINDCTGKDTGQVTVTYKDDEIKSRVIIVSGKETMIESARDSIELRVVWYNKYEEIAARPLDTTVGPGTHKIELINHKNKLKCKDKVDKRLPAGAYWQVVAADRMIFAEDSVKFKR